jgi:hypothetical protein
MKILSVIFSFSRASLKPALLQQYHLPPFVKGELKGDFAVRKM